MKLRRIILAAVAVPTAIVVFTAVMVFTLGSYFFKSNYASATSDQFSPSPVAILDIPPKMLALYQGPVAHRECPGLRWSVLAGIGKVETDHARSTAPGVSSGTNSAGAAGPMQFLLPTFDANAVDGNGDGKTNIYDPADAIPSAALYLCKNGGGDPATLDNALYNYNHPWWYAHGGEGTPYPGPGKPDYCFVLCWADRYEAAAKIIGPGPVSGGCANPFSDPIFQDPNHQGRTDEGVDYNVPTPAPIYAICDLTVISTDTTGWPGTVLNQGTNNEIYVNDGAFIFAKLTSGPYTGKCVYFAEHLGDLPSPGQHFKAGQKLATLMSNNAGLEAGWARGKSLPSVSSKSYPTAGGSAFARFLRSLGAPTQDNPGSGDMYAGDSCA